MASATFGMGVSCTHAALVRPGDTLVVALDRVGISAETAQDLKAKFEQRLPGVSVLICEANQLMVYRPDTETEGS